MISWNDIKIVFLRIFLYLNSCLAKVKVWLGIWKVKYGCYGYFEYKGLPSTYNLHKINRLDAIEGYDNFRPDDVILMTYPKTGTNFTAHVIADIYRETGLWDRKDGDRINVLEFKPPLLLIAKPKSTQVPATGIMADLDNAVGPRLIGTHLPFNFLPKRAREGHVKIIHCTRNPKDTLCSMFPFFKKMKVVVEDLSWDDFFSYFLSGKVAAGGFFDFLRAWYPHRNNEKMLNLTFEDMLQDLEGNVRRIAEFLNVDLTDEQVNKVVVANTFANRKKAAGKGHPIYRSGKSGGWRSEFTVEQNDMFNEWIKNESQGLDDLKLSID